jgi:fatty acid desaturase
VEDSIFTHTKVGRAEKIKELHQIRPAYNWIILFFFGLWAASSYLTLQMPNVWLRLSGYLLSGIVLHALGIMMHEGVHSNLSKNRKLNRWLGFLCGAPTLLGISAYKAVHLPHHRHERMVEDPDEFENLTRRPLLLKIILIGWFFVGAFFYLLHIPITGLKLASRQEKKKIIQEYLLIVLLAALAFYLVPFKILDQVWLIPLLVTAQLAQIRGLAEHAFTAGDDLLTASRTVTSNRIVSFFMCNLNYHLDHHIYPGVPWYNLPRLHRLFLEDYRKAGVSVFTSYTVYLWEVFKALFAKVTNPYLEAGRPSGYYRHYMPVLTGIPTAGKLEVLLNDEERSNR